MKASQLDVDIGLETLLSLSKPFLAPQATAAFMIYLIGSMAAMYVLKPRVLFNVFGGKSSEMNDRLVQMYGLGVAGAITHMYCLMVMEDASMDVVLTASRIAATPALIEFMMNFSNNPGFRSQGLVSLHFIPLLFRSDIPIDITHHKIMQLNTYLRRSDSSLQRYRCTPPHKNTLPYHQQNYSPCFGC